MFALQWILDKRWSWEVAQFIASGDRNAFHLLQKYLITNSPFFNKQARRKQNTFDDQPNEFYYAPRKSSIMCLDCGSIFNVCSSIILFNPLFQTLICILTTTDSLKCSSFCCFHEILMMTCHKHGKFIYLVCESKDASTTARPVELEATTEAYT